MLPFYRGIMDRWTDQCNTCAEGQTDVVRNRLEPLLRRIGRRPDGLIRRAAVRSVDAMKAWWLLACLATVAGADDWFAPYRSVADYRPKGPTHCYRQFNVDWSWVAMRPEEISRFLSKADPAALAEFLHESRVDGTVVMAVPHHGYCTHDTRVGEKFPGMKGDWFGRVIAELHRRRIAAFGYVTLNWNWKFIRENLGREFIHGEPDADGVCGWRCSICLNAPGYLELVEAYTREVLEGYPVDGMRWDILKTPEGCRCEGCRARYLEAYGEPLVDWETVPPERRREFWLATKERVVHRLRALCKRIKPSVEIWQNHIQSYHPINLDLSREMDIAYNEYGDLFRLLLIRGVSGRPAAIHGLMNKAPTNPPVPLDRAEWRACLALGGRCYSYYGHLHTDPETLLPGGPMPAWHREQLAPFYAMVATIEPWLADAAPVTHVGIVFSERTRFRFPGYERDPYIQAMEPIVNEYLRRSLPIEFVNALDLPDRSRDLSRFKLLILPRTSGLAAAELDALRQYVRDGGALLALGDALRHDASGAALPGFALAAELGVAPDAPPPEALVVAPCGAGRMAALGPLDPPRVFEAIDRLSGPPPIRVIPAEKRVVLTRQAKWNRWVLHFLDDGDCAVEIRSDAAAPKGISARYPAAGWTCALDATPDGVRISATGTAGDRLAVLE